MQKIAKNAQKKARNQYLPPATPAHNDDKIEKEKYNHDPHTLEVVRVINHNYLYDKKSKNKEKVCAFHI